MDVTSIQCWRDLPEKTKSMMNDGTTTTTTLITKLLMKISMKDIRAFESATETMSKQPAIQCYYCTETGATIQSRRNSDSK
jgi:hypothetical protein